MSGRHRGDSTVAEASASISSEKTRTLLHTVGGLHMGGVGNLLLRNVRLLDRERFRSHICYFRPRRDLLARYRREGVRPVHIPYHGPWSLPIAAVRLLRLARELRVDLLHANHHLDHLLAGLVGALSGVPVIRTLHHMVRPKADRKEPFRTLPQRWVKNAMNRWLTDHFIAVSESVADAHTRFSNVPAERVTVIHPGIARAEWEEPDAALVHRLREELRLDGAYPVLVNVGRLRPVKRQRRLVEMMPSVVAKWPRAKLLMVGEGESREEIEREVHRHRLQPHVQLLGTRSDVREILELSDIFVMTSDREGFGLSVVEAMLAGVPVVCSLTGAVTEIVESGSTGYIVTDEESMVKRILELAADEELASRIGHAGRTSAAKRFDLATSVRKLEETYERVLR